MPYFAKVINNKVVEVLSADAEFFVTYNDPNPGAWIQTSYNTRGGVHYGQDGQPDGGIALRGNYASVGFIYDPIHDVFYPEQPFNSWTISAPTWLWQAPIPYPDDGKQYFWDESIKEWVLSPLQPIGN
jgi:hypothetical protein